MQRRSFFFAGITFAAAILSTGKAGADDSKTSPNVLFIAIDDLNDWVGFLKGHPQVKTPNMDRLAKRGIVFTNAHCAAPLCCPSRAAVFSGRQPFHTGVYENNHRLRKMRPDLVLLPQYFKAHGYRTFGTGKLMHRRHPDLFDESFFPEQRWSPFTRKQVEYTAEELPSKGTKPRHVVKPGPTTNEAVVCEGIVLPFNGMPSDRAPNDPKGESFDWGPVDVPDDAMGDGKIANWSVERLRWRHKKPFFLAVGFYRPHIPLYAPKKYFALYPAKTTLLPKVSADDLSDLGPAARKTALEPVTAGRHAAVLKYGQWKNAVAAYLACVSFVDAQIGKMLDALEDGPHGKHTIVVLWSDHGWHLGEKQHWGKWTGWETSTRVPLLIVPALSDANRRYRTGSRCSQPVSLIDLYPTLIEMCGLPRKTRPSRATALDGVSLVPLLRNPQTYSGRAVVSTFGKNNYTVRTNRWSLIRYRDGSKELYDHSADPHEWHNLIRDPKYTIERKRLEAKLPRDVSE